MWSIKNMKRKFTVFSLILFLISYSAANIIGPEVTITQSGDIIVNTYFYNTEDFEASIRTGAAKDITINVYIKKIRGIWPDSVVKKKKIEKNIKYNSLKETFTVTSSDKGETTTEVYKDYFQMVKAALTIKDLLVANTHEFSPGKYYVMIVMESQRIKLPPVIGNLLFFVPKTEFTIERKSIPFDISDNY